MVAVLGRGGVAVSTGASQQSGWIWVPHGSWFLVPGEALTTTGQI